MIITVLKMITKIIFNTNWITIIADKQIKYGNELEQYTAKMAKNSEFLKYTSNYNSIFTKIEM